MFLRITCDFADHGLDVLTDDEILAAVKRWPASGTDRLPKGNPARLEPWYQVVFDLFEPPGGPKREPPLTQATSAINLRDAWDKGEKRRDSRRVMQAEEQAKERLQIPVHKFKGV